MTNILPKIGIALGLLGTIASILSFDWSSSGLVQDILIALASLRFELVGILCLSVFLHYRPRALAFIWHSSSTELPLILGAIVAMAGAALIYAVFLIERVHENIGIESVHVLEKSGEFDAASMRAGYLLKKGRGDRLELRQLEIQMRSKRILQNYLERELLSEPESKFKDARKEFGRTFDPSNPAFKD